VSALADSSITATVSVPAGRETILVVEDDVSVRNMAVTTLEALGYRVRQAADGRIGLKILQDDGAIDLLFTDMIMPNGMSGLELIRAARELRPDVKALLTSGYSEQFIKSVDVVPDVQLLSKPYRREKLACTFRAVLDSNC
jgi:CheY-like chemotaxis protein